MKIVTVIGARPQFIKASAISRLLRQEGDQCTEVLIHTGQHHDHSMSESFFEELSIPTPQYNLGVAGGGHGEMTGRMLEKIEKVLENERPDIVLVYGDTNSTLAGALAAKKLHIHVAHVEAGLRSFNMNMPEEINRVLTDKLSSLLLCPTSKAQDNLFHEGQSDRVYVVGDVMYDVALRTVASAEREAELLDQLGLTAGEFVLSTCHRAESTNSPTALRSILAGIQRVSRDARVVLPLHPRTRKRIEQLGYGRLLDDVTVIEPVSYTSMSILEHSCAQVMTDSGGVQKEAYFFGKPCITLRNETEWTETVDAGWNILAGHDEAAIFAAYSRTKSEGFNKQPRPNFYGDGNSASKIISILKEFAG